MNHKEEDIRAFPQPQNQKYFSGMSLRDYFAAKAMQGMIINPLAFSYTGDKTLANQSYLIADAMLKARRL